MLFIPVGDGGAHVMVCDEVCLDAVSNRLPIPELIPLSTTVVCAACVACSLTVAGTHCPCAGLQVSCSAPSWLLCTQARTALDTIYEMAGPVTLTDADWQELQSFSEEVWSGGLVGLMWVREHQSDLDRREGRS